MLFLRSLNSGIHTTPRDAGVGMHATVLRRVASTATKLPQVGLHNSRIASTTWWR